MYVIRIIIFRIIDTTLTIIAIIQENSGTFFERILFF